MVPTTTRVTGTRTTKTRLITRVEAERKLAQALGDEILYARYVRKRMREWSNERLRLLVSKFTGGDIGDLEQTINRLSGAFAQEQYSSTMRRVHLDDEFIEPNARE